MTINNNIGADMAIKPRQCEVCEGEFHGSKNAMYCSNACKQKAYERRKKSKNTEQLSPSESSTDSSRDNAADRDGEE